MRWGDFLRGKKEREEKYRDSDVRGICGTSGYTVYLEQRVGVGDL